MSEFDLSRIMVNVNGMSYPTYMDKNGTQRFVSNTIVEAMVDSSLEHRNAPGVFTINDVTELFFEGKFTLREYAEFSMLHGYSVGGFEEIMDSKYSGLELDWEQYYELINPLWESETQPSVQRFNEEARNPYWELSVPHENIFLVAVNGKEYPAYEDEFGQKMFVLNRIVQEFVSAMSYFGEFNIDSVDKMLTKGESTIHDYLEFYILNGCSFEAFPELVEEAHKLVKLDMTDDFELKVN